MRKTATAVAAAALALLGAAPAAAAPAPASYADIVGTVNIISPTTAEIQVRYRCSGEVDSLWTSVKQGADADQAHAGYGGGELTAWAQAHDPSGLICDGKNHVGRFMVGHTGEPGRGALAKGRAYVQFCLYTPDAEITSMEFVQAR